MLRKIFFVFIFSIFSISSVYADDFCDSFERGYIAGYKQASGLSLDSLTPLCFLQLLKKLSDSDSDFEHGYIIGLKKGMEDG